jgi:hypothetical protein
MLNLLNFRCRLPVDNSDCRFPIDNGRHRLDIDDSRYRLHIQQELIISAAAARNRYNALMVALGLLSAPAVEEKKPRKVSVTKVTAPEVAKTAKKAAGSKKVKATPKKTKAAVSAE